MLNSLKKSFNIVKENPFITLYFVLYLIILFLIIPILIAGRNIFISMILGVLILLLTCAFISGWFNMIKTSTLNFKENKTPEQKLEEAVKLKNDFFCDLPGCTFKIKATRKSHQSGKSFGKQERRKQNSRLFGISANGWPYAEDFLHAAGGLGQACHFAGSLAGAGGEEFVHFLQFVTGVLGQDTHHGGDAVLLVVILQEVQNLLMVRSDFRDTFGLFYVFEPFGAPVVETKQETVFVDFKGFPFVRDFSHARPPWTC